MTNLFGHSVRSELLLLFVAEAVACFLAFYLILAWGLDGSASASPTGLALLAGGLAACSGLISGASGLYQADSWQHLRRLLAGIAVACLFLLLIVQLVFPAVAPLSAGWRGQVEMLAAFAAALLLTRVALMTASRIGLLRRRIVVVQGGPADAARWSRQDPHFELALSVPAEADPGVWLSPARLKGMRTWAVVAPAPAALPAAVREELANASIRLLDEAEFWERRLGRVDLARLAPGWLADANAVRAKPLQAFLRRGCDLLFALILLAVSLPVLLLAAIAIKLDSPGPIFYRQERVGLGGRVFTLFKFRSMVVDAEAQGAPRWATQRDPRVTRVGRILRLTRIDEIPQVINVLRGDMGFVGPRPERPAFVAQLTEAIPHYADRQVVKPGITGWAQVNYPYGASVEDARQKLAYDLYYVRRRSLFLDLLILVATVRVVLFQEGSR